MVSPVPPRKIWLLLAGFTLWAIGFVALYALQALGCAYGWSPDLHRLALVGTFAAFVAAQIAIVLVLRWRDQADPPAPFLDRAGMWANIAAAASAVLIFSPVLFASACI